MTPGPSNVMLTAAGANAGVWHGLPCLLGVSTGMGVMMFLVPLGLGSFVLGMPRLVEALRWTGAGFLLWLAWKIATGRRLESSPQREPVGYLGAAVLQWVNPKSWLVSTSAAATYLDGGAASALAQSAGLGVLFVVAALPSGFLWLAFGATVQRVLRDDRRRRMFNVAMAILLAMSVALMVR